MNGERHHTESRLYLLPKIIEFLGCDSRQKRITKGISEQLIGYRKQQGLNQRKIARLLGIDTKTLCRWERDESQPNEKANKRDVEFLQSKIPKDLGRQISQLNSRGRPCDRPYVRSDVSSYFINNIFFTWLKFALPSLACTVRR